MTMLERIELVLKLNKWSSREWCRRAGLSEESHLSTFMTRLRKNPDATIDFITAAKLADAANVSLDWLALGRGSPEPPAPTPDSRYPSREQVVLGGRLFGLFSEASIRAVEAIDHLPHDPGPAFWLMQLMANTPMWSPTPPPKLPPHDPTGSDKWPVRSKRRR